MSTCYPCKVGAGGIEEDVHSIMRSSGPISLFTEPAPTPLMSAPVVVSMLMHAAAFAVVYLGLVSAPRIVNRPMNARYPVRVLNLRREEAEEHKSTGSGIAYPGPQTAANAPAPGGKPAAAAGIAMQVADRTPARPRIAPPVAYPKTSPQTLVQPDIPPTQLLTQETPIPTVVLWSPEKAVSKSIVPPPPHPPVAANVQPSLDAPNQEVNLAGFSVAANAQAKTAIPLLPSTSTPVAVHKAQPESKPPETTSDTAAQPTPARIMSLSDVQMHEGKITLPPANQTAAADNSPTPAPQKPAVSLQPGKGISAGTTSAAATAKTSAAGQGGSNQGEKPATAGKAVGQGASQSANSKGDKPSQAAKPSAAPRPQSASGKSDKPTTAPGSGTQAVANPGPAKGAASGASSEDDPSQAHISLPRDGKFGVVVVGSSLEEQYPEIAPVWGGRLAYTVYLHVGLAKSWILQYSVPRSDEAAAAGSVARLDAPWPFEIVRPNIDPGSINADALMVHGTVNKAGRFESLNIVFPPDFPQARFVLNTLRQWQFRPATQSGQNTDVEILLIIPDQLE
jgi:hypothetical protein